MNEEEDLTLIIDDIESQSQNEGDKRTLVDSMNDSDDVLADKTENDENSRADYFEENNEIESEKSKLETTLKIASEVFENEITSLDQLNEFLTKKSQKNTKNNQIIENEEKNSQWFKEDKRQFFEQFPSFSEQSLKELFSDEIFMEFSKNRLGKERLKDIYLAYEKLSQKIDILSEKKAQIMYSKRFSSPGSMQYANLTNTTVWDSMSEQEFEKAISDAKKGYYSKK